MERPPSADAHRRARAALRTTSEQLLTRVRASATAEELRAVFDDACVLAARFPTSPRALRVLRTCATARVYALARRGDIAGLRAHLSALDTLHDEVRARPAFAALVAQTLATIAHESSRLDEPTRAEFLAQAESLLARHPREGLVLAWCSDAIETLTLGDPDAMARLARSLRTKLDRAPEDPGLRIRWSSTVARCTDRLRRAKRWAEIAPWRDALAQEMTGPPPRVEVAVALAQATRNVIFAHAESDDVEALERELDTLRALRDDARARRDLRRRELVVEWVWGARLAVAAHGERSWQWGASAAEPVADAQRHLDAAEQHLVAMWTAVLRGAMSRAADLLAQALQDFTWCARVARDDVREARWHDRLARLVVTRPHSAAERYWALSSGSRALTLVERGDADGALVTAAAVCACAARRGDDAVVREAHGKALCAIEKARRMRHEHDEGDDAARTLESLATQHAGEAMLTRFFSHAARSRVGAWLDAGDASRAWAWVERLGVVAALPQGEGLARGVLAQALRDVALREGARGDEARRWLRRLAKENPRNETVKTACAEATAKR